MGDKFKEVVLDDIDTSTSITEAINEAIRVSGDYGKDLDSGHSGTLVKFEFNRITVSVHFDSDPKLIQRDYWRAVRGHIGKKVGPYPAPTFPNDEGRQDGEEQEEEEEY